MADFSYKNLISKFFSSAGKLESRSDRIKTCIQFVADEVPGKCPRSQLAIKKAVLSVDASFMNKFRKANCLMERFEEENEKWIRTCLKVC